ncbi:unnamed protein product [Prunus armeniaca]
MSRGEAASYFGGAGLGSVRFAGPDCGPRAGPLELGLLPSLGAGLGIGGCANSTFFRLPLFLLGPCRSARYKDWRRKLKGR